jgi:hypothetical protein
MTDGSIEAEELERTADWRIRKVGEDPNDGQSASAAKLLQRLADDVRSLRGSSAYAEYLTILNWLGEFDVMEEFAERAHTYRSRIGIEHFPETGEAYLQALTALAREIAGT